MAGFDLSSLLFVLDTTSLLMDDLTKLGRDVGSSFSGATDWAFHLA